MPRGGKRAGAGRPKGSKEKRTLEKEEARRLLREQVFKRLTPLIEAQVANAMGIKYLVARNKHGGTFKRVVGAEERLKAGPSDEEIIEVWEKDPSIQAFTDLMNRALDKPAEQEQTINLNLSGGIEARLKAARERLAKAKSGNGRPVS